MAETCGACWGTHGCIYPEGHNGDHFCCCFCPDSNHIPGGSCVGAWPFYGVGTEIRYLDDEFETVRVEVVT